MANRFGSVEHLREQLKRNQESRPGVRNFVAAFPSEDVRAALKVIGDLQELVSAGEALANAVGPLVEESMERNGPQVDGWIVEEYRNFRKTQNQDSVVSEEK